LGDWSFNCAGVFLTVYNGDTCYKLLSTLSCDFDVLIELSINLLVFSVILGYFYCDLSTFKELIKSLSLTDYYLAALSNSINPSPSPASSSSSSNSASYMYSSTSCSWFST